MRPGAAKIFVIAHVLVLLCLALAVGVGTHYYSGKWSALTSRTSRVELSALIEASKDLPVIQSILLEPAVSEAYQNVPLVNAHPEELSLSALLPADKLLSIYVPSHERHLAQFGGNIQNALVCSQLEEEFGDWAVPEPIPYDLARLAESAFNEGEVSAVIEPPTPHMTVSNTREIHATSADQGVGRRCILWQRDTSFYRAQMPSLTVVTNGLLAPNYPLYKVTTFFTQTIAGNLLIILFAWCHSLTLPQPVSVVHTPRLVFYMLLGVWRIAVLYLGVNALESLPVLQAAWGGLEMWLKDNPVLNMNGYEHVTSGRLFTPKFDSSDHIVICIYLSVVVASEIVCMWLFRRAKEDKENIDNPFKMARRGLVLLGLGMASVLLLLLYNCCMTAAFHHTPLESFAAVFIGAAGVLVPWWTAIYMDVFNVARFSFGM